MYDAGELVQVAAVGNLLGRGTSRLRVRTPKGWVSVKATNGKQLWVHAEQKTSHHKLEERPASAVAEREEFSIKSPLIAQSEAAQGAKQEDEQSATLQQAAEKWATKMQEKMHNAKPKNKSPRFCCGARAEQPREDRRRS